MYVINTNKKPVYHTPLYEIKYIINNDNRKLVMYIKNHFLNLKYINESVITIEKFNNVNSLGLTTSDIKLISVIRITGEK